MRKYSSILTEAGLLITLVISLSYFTINRLILPQINQNTNSQNILGSTSSIGQSVLTFAWIGDHRFTLFGYTSPLALVTIDGAGIYDQTYADNAGYFKFDNRFSPLSPREACLTAKDQFGRNTTPVCLPPFPTTYNTSIGPILIPPTLSFDKNDYFTNEQIVLSGQTIPNTSVDLSIFIDEKKSFINYIVRSIDNFNLIKPVEAFTFPQINTISDNKGNYSISLPSTHPNFYRLFMRANYFNSDSPKSNTLNIKVLPIWMIIIQIFTFILNLLRPHLIEVIILIELMSLFGYYLRKHFHPYLLSHNKALAIREKYSLLLIK